MTILCAQLSDLHLDGSETTRNRLRRIVAELAAYPRPVAAILVSGDIVECSSFPEDPDAALAEYRLVHELLAPLAPVGYCAGNSDWEPFDRFLDEVAPGSEGGNTRLEAGDATFLLVNTRVPDAYHGHLGEQALTWLERELARQATPVVLVMHHPPVPFGHPVIDTLRLDNPDALADAIRRFPNVTGTLCGHTHAAAATLFANRLLFVAPGVHSYGQLPWAYTGDASSMIDPMTPPGYALYSVDAHGLSGFPVLLDKTTMDRG